MGQYVKWIGIALALFALFGIASSLASDGNSFNYFIGRLVGSIIVFMAGLWLYRKGKRH